MRNCGLDWYRGDFHVHTPFSNCYRDCGVTAKQILEGLSGLDFAVIADHNTFEGYFNLLEQRMDSMPILLPGVELKVSGGYRGLNMLAVFNPDLPPDELEVFLRECMIPSEAKGDSSLIVPRALPELAALLKKYNAFCLWTKIGSCEGIIGGVDAVQREYITSQAWPLALMELGEKEEPDGVWGSNAHNLKEIGKHTTFVKLESLDFDSLKYALQDLKARVLPGTGKSENNYPRILSLRVEGGFLGGQEFVFNPGLNCIIGARGTGKSTMLKHLAFALGNRFTVDDAVEAVEVSLLDESGQLWRSRRQPGGEVQVFDRLGRRITRDLTGYAWMFSQGEIERVVLNPGYQMELLDSQWDSAAANRQFAEISQALAENEAVLNALGMECDELQELLAGREVLEQRLQELQAYPLGEIQAKLAERERELRQLSSLKDIVRQNQALLNRIPYPGGQTVPFLAAAMQLTRDYAGKLAEVWKEAQAQLEEHALELEHRHLMLEEEYSSLLGGCADSRIRDLIKERQNIQTELLGLEPVAEKFSQAEKKYKQADAERGQLLKNWTSLGEERFSGRSAAAANLNRLMHPAVRIEVQRGGISTPYREFLNRWLGSIGPSAQKLLEARVPISLLIDLVESGEAVSLAKQSGLALDRCRRIVSLLNSRRALLQARAVENPDAVRIYLRQGLEEKAGSRLSTGQRCTAVLPLLLLGAKGPLVIDQPEDHLDNAYVCSTLVNKLRELKSRRQFIFATHNPNIPVLADAEQNFVLESDGRAGWVKAQGAVENSSVKELIQEVMEGGQDAFKRRARRYGQLAP